MKLECYHYVHFDYPNRYHREILTNVYRLLFQVSTSCSKFCHLFCSFGFIFGGYDQIVYTKNEDNHRREIVLQLLFPDTCLIFQTSTYDYAGGVSIFYICHVMQVLVDGCIRDKLDIIVQKDYSE